MHEWHLLELLNLVDITFEKSLSENFASVYVAKTGKVSNVGVSRLFKLDLSNRINAILYIGMLFGTKASKAFLFVKQARLSFF